MKFLIDNQLPLLLAGYLRTRGHQATHVLELSLDEAEDSDVGQRCAADDHVLISKDEDFVFFALRPGDRGRLIWIRLGNCRNATLIETFDRILDSAILMFEGGQRIVEIR